MSQSFSVFVNFDGNCADALKFYSEVFGVEPGSLMTFADAPPDPSFTVTEELAPQIMYSNLMIAGTSIMFSDIPPGTEFTAGTNVILNIASTNEQDLRTWYDRLQAGGHIIMPLGETFFAPMYAMVLDKFGIYWNIIMNKN
ncbi:MAG: VOC family protein [Defluviitaleaceae bacterium]|nr:VOC family protein [Defluviitaleaceae bacterium]